MDSMMNYKRELCEVVHSYPGVSPHQIALLLNAEDYDDMHLIVETLNAATQDGWLWWFGTSPNVRVITTAKYDRERTPVSGR